MSKKDRKANEKSLSRLRIARRSVIYVMRTLLLISAGAILCIGAFLTAERISNLYILTTEGMAMRADCVVKNESLLDLQEYFTLPFIAQDEALTAGTYENYTILNADYDLAISSVRVYPWSTSATVRALESMSLKGSINADQLPEGQLAADYPLPVWQTRSYDIHFIYVEGRWFISELEVVDENPEIPPLKTPDPNLTPRPMATPTPEPTEEPIEAIDFEILS